MKTFTLLMLLLSCSIMAIGQKTGRLTGVVKANEKETMVGATILITPGFLGAVSDEEGRFRFNNILSGNYTMKVSFIGYKTFTTQVSIAANENKTLNVSLEEEGITLTGLTVTAQKRSENQKEVPIALTSISSKFIESNVTETMAGMSAYVPGVQVQEQTALFPSYVIRGLTSDDLGLNQDNRVSVFQDGISTSKAIGAHTEFFDIDRVEVLKGPQGTLFGRSAQIGAIDMITNHAKNETSGNFTIGTGNYNQQRVNGYINVPLVNNKLFARIAGIYNKRDGYEENLSGGNLMGKNTIGARASLKYLPTKNSSFDLIMNYENDNNPGQDFKSGTFAPKGGDTSPFTFADLGTGNEVKDKRKVLGITDIYKQYFNSALSLTAITGYRTITSSSFSDSDGTKAQALDINVDLSYNQFSQEVRLNYDGFQGL